MHEGLEGKDQFLEDPRIISQGRGTAMICIPITGNTQEEALLQIEMSLPRAHVLELRMDLISGDLQTLMERCRSYPIPVKILVTNRRREPSPSGESRGEGRGSLCWKRLSVLARIMWTLNLIRRSPFVRVCLRWQAPMATGPG